MKNKHNQIHNTENLEDIEIKLTRVLQIQKDLKQRLSAMNSKYQGYEAILSSLKNAHSQLKKSFLFSKVNNFQTLQGKLKNLSLTAVLPQTFSTKQTKIQKSQCKQGKHLFDILDLQNEKKQQQIIKNLQYKLGQLYNRITQCCEQQGMNDKVLNRIKKQAKRASKLKLLSYLQKCIANHKGWILQQNNKINNELKNKQIQQKLMTNLSKMKLLMNKKIDNNDYIYDTIGQESSISHHLQNINTLLHPIINQYQQFNRKQQQYLHQPTHTHNYDKPIKIQKQTKFDIEMIKKYFQNCQTLIKDIEHFQYNQQFITHCQSLQSTINSTNKQSFK